MTCQLHNTTGANGPKNYQLDMESNINYELFRELAVNAGFEDLELLEVVYSDL